MESNILVGNVFKNFPKRDIFAEHKRIAREGVKYPCGQCGRQISQRKSLAKHKRTVYQGAKYPLNENLAILSKSVHKSQ